MSTKGRCGNTIGNATLITAEAFRMQSSGQMLFGGFVPVLKGLVRA